MMKDNITFDELRIADKAAENFQDKCIAALAKEAEECENLSKYRIGKDRNSDKWEYKRRAYLRAIEIIKKIK